MAKAASIVGSRLDYCNSVLYSVSQASIDRLQRVQNVLARVVALAPSTAPYIFSVICTGSQLTIVSAINLVCLPGKQCTLLNHPTFLS